MSHGNRLNPSLTKHLFTMFYGETSLEETFEKMHEMRDARAQQERAAGNTGSPGTAVKKHSVEHCVATRAERDVRLLMGDHLEASTLDKLLQEMLDNMKTVPGNLPPAPYVQ